MSTAPRTAADTALLDVAQLGHVGRYRVQRARVPARRHPGGDRGQRVLVQRVGGRRPLEARQRDFAIRAPHAEPRQRCDLPPGRVSPGCRHSLRATRAARPDGAPSHHTGLPGPPPSIASRTCSPVDDAKAMERFPDTVDHAEHRQRHLDRDGSRAGGLAGRLPPVMLRHGWQSPFLIAAPVLPQDRARSRHPLHISSSSTASAMDIPLR